MSDKKNVANDHIINNGDYTLNRTVCAVPDCSKRYEPGISFHSFPKRKDKKRLKLWIQSLRVKFMPTENSRVCSLHFSVQQFIPPSK